MPFTSTHVNRPVNGPALDRSGLADEHATNNGNVSTNANSNVAANREPTYNFAYIHITTPQRPSIISKMREISSAILDRVWPKPQPQVDMSSLNEALKACADADSQTQFTYLASNSRDVYLVSKHTDVATMQPALDSFRDANTRLVDPCVGLLEACASLLSGRFVSLYILLVVLWFTGGKDVIMKLVNEYFKAK